MPPVVSLESVAGARLAIDNHLHLHTVTSIWYIDPALLTMVLQFQPATCTTVKRYSRRYNSKPCQMAFQIAFLYMLCLFTDDMIIRDLRILVLLLF